MYHIISAFALRTASHNLIVICLRFAPSHHLTRGLSSLKENKQIDKQPVIETLDYNQVWPTFQPQASRYAILPIPLITSTKHLALSLRQSPFPRLLDCIMQG